MTDKEAVIYLVGEIINGELSSLPEEDYDWYYDWYFNNNIYLQAVNKAEEILNKVNEKCN